MSGHKIEVAGAGIKGINLSRVTFRAPEDFVMLGGEFVEGGHLLLLLIIKFHQSVADVFQGRGDYEFPLPVTEFGIGNVLSFVFSPSYIDDCVSFFETIASGSFCKVSFHGRFPSLLCVYDSMVEGNCQEILNFSFIGDLLAGVVNSGVEPDPSHRGIPSCLLSRLWVISTPLSTGIPPVWQ